jgi:ligand-binding sensor domain-containing protein
LALFSKETDGGQIEDFYGRFGSFNPDPAVKDILILGDTIWIATSSGIAMADKSNPDLLKSYLNWKTFNFSNYPELGTDNMTSLVYYHGSIYVGGYKGAYRLTIIGDDTSFVRLPTRNNIIVQRIEVDGDSLIVYAAGGFFVYNGTTTSWNHTPNLPEGVFMSGQFIDTIHWIGLQSKGIYFGEDSIYAKYPDGGLPGNNVTALSSNMDGRLVGCFYKDNIARLEKDSWIPFYSRTGEWATSTVQDDSGGIWIGTWGDGLGLVSDDTTIVFKEDNSLLSGVSENPLYVVVLKLCYRDNHIFMTNYGSRDGDGVKVVNINDITQWGSFGPDDGIPINALTAIDCYNGWFAAGTADKGVYYYHYGENPFEKQDDSVINLREDNSWLGSNTVNVVKFDNNGILWVGTKYGLSRYDPGIERFINVLLPDGFGPEVTALTFDSRGNIWIGSRTGLARYDATEYSIEVFTILNSGLSDNQINALVINPVTNDLWIGTPTGISRLQSDIGQPTRNIEEVIAFPNPFIIHGKEDVLSLNYDGTATVRYYSTAGELVRETSANTPWDGKNQSGASVSSGVYLFLITAADGSVGKGKILLIHE